MTVRTLIRTTGKGVSPDMLEFLRQRLGDAVVLEEILVQDIPELPLIDHTVKFYVHKGGRFGVRQLMNLLGDGVTLIMDDAENFLIRVYEETTYLYQKERLAIMDTDLFKRVFPKKTSQVARYGLANLLSEESKFDYIFRPTEVTLDMAKKAMGIFFPSEPLPMQIRWPEVDEDDIPLKVFIKPKNEKQALTAQEFLSLRKEEYNVFYFHDLLIRFVGSQTHVYQGIFLGDYNIMYVSTFMNAFKEHKEDFLHERIREILKKEPVIASEGRMSYMEAIRRMGLNPNLLKKEV